MSPRLGERALRLTRAEFAALAIVLGEPPPAAAGVTPADLRAALASLHERGVLRSGEPLRVPVAAARLLEIVRRPVLTVEVYTARAGHWRPVPDRLAAVPEAAVEVAADGDAWRLTPLATGDLLRRLARRCGLAGCDLPRAPGAVLPLRALRAAVAAAAAGPEPAAEALLAGGAPQATAAAVAGALADGVHAAVGVRLRAGPGRRTGGEYAWAAGRDGCWWLPPVLTPIAGGAGDPAGGPGPGRPEPGRDPGPGDDLTVRIGPCSPEEIMAALAAAVPSGWLVA